MSDHPSPPHGTGFAWPRACVRHWNGPILEIHAVPTIHFKMWLFHLNMVCFRGSAFLRFLKNVIISSLCWFSQQWKQPGNVCSSHKSTIHGDLSCPGDLVPLRFDRSRICSAFVRRLRCPDSLFTADHSFISQIYFILCQLILFKAVADVHKVTASKVASLFSNLSLSDFRKSSDWCYNIRNSCPSPLTP